MPFGTAFSAGILARPSAWVLIAINLSMIAGVVYFEWSVIEIVFLYWVENLVVGAINVIRMLVSGGGGPHMPPSFDRRIDALEAGYDFPPRQPGRAANTVIKLFLVPFFILHYGGFCYGHGVFVLAMFGDGMSMNAADILGLVTGPLQVAILALTASHLLSFFFNFIGRGEFRNTNAAALMMRPYGRIVALHLTILLGAFLALVFDKQAGMLVILVIMKTAADLGLHHAERVKLAAKPG